MPRALVTISGDVLLRSPANSDATESGRSITVRIPRSRTCWRAVSDVNVHTPSDRPPDDELSAEAFA